LKREFTRAKTFLGLMVALALALSIVTVIPVIAQPTFTGDVETNFPAGPTVLIFVDAGGKDVPVPTHPVPGTSSGWDIKDVRLVYDPATDILYVGLNSYETVGDADTDGNEGLMTYDSGIDIPNLGSGESVAVYFDLNQDGNWDVIAGVPSDIDFSGFTIKSATGSPPSMAFFGANLTTGYDHLGIRYWTPSSAPDLEFEIWNFSHLPNQDGELSAFTIGAFMGSVADVTITEDWLLGSNGPAAINIVKKTNGTDNNSPTGPYIAVNDTVTWTYNVTNPGSVNLTSIVVTDDNGTPANPADDFYPTRISGDDGDNILETTEAWIYEASGNATLGQYSNIGTATGYSDGFNVTDSDPDHYLGVKAKIEIEPLEETNNVGEEHVLTACVYVDSGSGYALYLQPITIDFSKVGVGNLSVTSVPTITGCAQTILTSNVTGNSTITAQSAFTVGGAGGASFNISTDGTGDNSEPAEKDWEAETGIDIEKHTNGEDADTGPGPSIPMGGNVTWTYNVTNTGDFDLDPVVVVDDNGTPGNMSDDFNPTYIGGDDGDGKLNPLETWYYSHNGTATVGLYANVATVTGKPPVGANVSDSDPSHYTGLGPDIDIEKHTNGQDADSAPGPYITIGSTVTWTYIVKNTGGVNLTNVVVTDDKLGPIGTIPSLPVDAEQTLYAYGTAAAGQYANVAAVTGKPPVGANVSDSDPSHYFGRTPPPPPPPPTVGWETYPINKVRVLLPWIALLAAVMVGAGLLVLRHRRAQS
jgi:hypothetical protein